MEFLRFGSSIPGSYWGCCACCIIQNFKVDPDAKVAIQLVEGDGGVPYTPNKFAGPTYRDIFWQRLRYGTFGTADMPNHAFFAILAKTQINTEIGKKWLAILKEAGFEFLRTVNNSVWNADNYIFCLVRNVGPNAVKDQFTPPKEWTDLPDVVPEPSRIFEQIFNGAEPWQAPELTKKIAEAQKPLYEALPKGKFLSEEQAVTAGCEIHYAGKRSHQHKQFAVGYPQQTAAKRAEFEAAFVALTSKEKQATPSLRAMSPVTTQG